MKDNPIFWMAVAIFHCIYWLLRTWRKYFGSNDYMDQSNFDIESDRYELENGPGPKPR
jgi:hypothetical protein